MVKINDKGKTELGSHKLSTQCPKEEQHVFSEAVPVSSQLICKAI